MILLPSHREKDYILTCYLVIIIIIINNIFDWSASIMQKEKTNFFSRIISKIVGESKPTFRQYTAKQLEVILVKTRVIFNKEIERLEGLIKKSDSKLVKLNMSNQSEQYDLFQEIGQKIIQINAIKILITLCKKLEDQTNTIIEAKGNVKQIEEEIKWLKCLMWFRRIKQFQKLEDLKQFCYNYFAGVDITEDKEIEVELYVEVKNAKIKLGQIPLDIMRNQIDYVINKEYSTQRKQLIFNRNRKYINSIKKANMSKSQNFKPIQNNNFIPNPYNYNTNPNNMNNNFNNATSTIKNPNSQNNFNPSSNFTFNNKNNPMSTINNNSNIYGPSNNNPNNNFSNNNNNNFNPINNNANNNNISKIRPGNNNNYDTNTNNFYPSFQQNNNNNSNIHNDNRYKQDEAERKQREFYEKKRRDEQEWRKRNQYLENKKREDEQIKRKFLEEQKRKMQEEQRRKIQNNRRLQEESRIQLLQIENRRRQQEDQRKRQEYERKKRQSEQEQRRLLEQKRKRAEYEQEMYNTTLRMNQERQRKRLQEQQERKRKLQEQRKMHQTNKVPNNNNQQEDQFQQQIRKRMEMLSSDFKPMEKKQIKQVQKIKQVTNNNQVTESLDEHELFSINTIKQVLKSSKKGFIKKPYMISIYARNEYINLVNKK